MEGWAEFCGEMRQYYGVDMDCLSDEFRWAGGRAGKGPAERAHIWRQLCVVPFGVAQCEAPTVGQGQRGGQTGTRDTLPCAAYKPPTPSLPSCALRLTASRREQSDYYMCSLQAAYAVPALLCPAPRCPQARAERLLLRHLGLDGRAPLRHAGPRHLLQDVRPAHRDAGGDQGAAQGGRAAGGMREKAAGCLGRGQGR